MTIQQLSVFLENKSGRLNQILDALSSAEISIIAATVADTSEYGILRLITSDTAKAYEVLRANQISSNRSEVIAISCESSAAAFASCIECFSQSGISIEYMYCFSIKSQAFLILKPNDLAGALEVVKTKGLHALTNEQLLDL